MAKVKIDNGQLIISMQGARKILALKSELSVPLSSIKSVSADPLAWKDSPIFKLYGSRIPGILLEGAFIQDGSKTFYDIKRSEDNVIIGLEDADFSKIVFGTEDPEAVVKLINEALNK
ncbi:MAG: hypothetical protein FWC47_12145 [Oscillospiraceae bacterium]|nr:hypothetical protein [Oscillospiraceae bacterium]